jgi:SHS2 domain-containing protein
MAYWFEFLEDIAMADLAFDAAGDSLPELFQGATHALMESLADPSTIGASWRQDIVREDREPSDLLFDWLSDLVYWKDAAGVVFSRFDLNLSQGTDGLWKLHATVYGEPVNGATQELRADVKGVTKHLYLMTGEDGRWKVRIVLDV